MKREALHGAAPLFLNAHICFYFETYVILSVLPPPIMALKGGVIMELTISFISSVVAGVVAYYICKWLDGE